MAQQARRGPGGGRVAGMRRAGARGLALACALAWAGAAGAEGADGAALFAPCAACHGARGEGVPAAGAPSLAGQSGPYLARQLRGFRDGVRGAAAGDAEGAAMRAASAGLTDAAIDALVAHVATLPEATTPASVEGDLRSGAKLYETRCNACHGPRAEGNPLLVSPRLAGVSDGYLLRQLTRFRTGARGSGADDRFGRQMAMMARTLPDEQAERDVIAYVRSLADAAGAEGAPAHGTPR